MIESMFNIQSKVLHFTIKTTRPDIDNQFLNFLETQVLKDFII
jgi:Holliday junction resolvase RusA-like endonuclease